MVIRSVRMTPSRRRNGCGVATVVGNRDVDRRVARGRCSGFVTMSSCRHVGLFSGIFGRISVGSENSKINLNAGVNTTLLTKLHVTKSIACNTTSVIRGVRRVGRPRTNPRVCMRRRYTRPHPCFGPNMSAPVSMTTQGFRTTVGVSNPSRRVDGKHWGEGPVGRGRLRCDSFLRGLDVRRILRSTNCRLGGHSNVHCPSCIHVKDSNYHIQNSGFLIAPGNTYYFRPPRRGGFGIVDFVGRRPRLFGSCGIKVSPSHLIGLMYGHLLGIPVRRHGRHVFRPTGRAGPFRSDSCRLRGFCPGSGSDRGGFCNCFGPQNVSLAARCTFGGNFFLSAGRVPSNGHFAGLSFPLHGPDRPRGIIKVRRQDHPGTRNIASCGNVTEGSGTTRNL